MPIIRNVSNGPLIIAGTPSHHLLPGSAVAIPDRLLKIPQVKNLMNKDFLKQVKIQERAEPVTRKAEKKEEVKKEKKEVRKEVKSEVKEKVKEEVKEELKEEEKKVEAKKKIEKSGLEKKTKKP